MRFDWTLGYLVPFTEATWTISKFFHKLDEVTHLHAKPLFRSVYLSSSASTAAFRFLSCRPPTLQETTPPRPSSYSISTKERNRPNDQCRLHAFTVKTCVQVCTLPLVKTTCSSADNFFGTIVSIAIVLIIEAAFALAPSIWRKKHEVIKL